MSSNFKVVVLLLSAVTHAPFHAPVLRPTKVVVIKRFIFANMDNFKNCTLQLKNYSVAWSRGLRDVTAASGLGARRHDSDVSAD